METEIKTKRYRIRAFVALLCVVLAACSKSALYQDDVTLFLDIEDLPIPDGWESEGLQPSSDYIAQSASAEDAYLVTWEPESDRDYPPQLLIVVFRYNTLSSAKQEYKSKTRELREPPYGTPETFTGDWANDSALFCNAFSLGKCVFVARYGNVVIWSSVMEGHGSNLDNAEELFAIIDNHTYTIYQQSVSIHE